MSEFCCPIREEEERANDEIDNPQANKHDLGWGELLSETKRIRRKTAMLPTVGESENTESNDRVSKCRNRCIDLFRKLSDALETMLRHLIDKESTKITEELNDVISHIVETERIKTECGTIIESGGLAGLWSKITLQKRSARKIRADNGAKDTKLRNNRLELWKRREEIDSGGTFDGKEDLERKRDKWSEKATKLENESDVDTHSLRQLFFSFSKNLKELSNEEEIKQLMNDPDFSSAFDKVIGPLGVSSVVMPLEDDQLKSRV
jgi:hypothetical protein